MKRNKITLALSSILLSVSLVGCSSSDGLNRSAKDGKENEVEKAAIKLVKGYCTQKVGQNIKLFLFSILNFKVSKFYYF